jgi:hypothetical protein
MKEYKLGVAGNVACRRLGIRAKCSLESLKGRDHLEDTGVDGRIILKELSERV